MSLLLLSASLCLLILAGALYVLQLSKNQYKNTLIYDAKLRSQVRAVSGCVEKQHAAVNFEIDAEPEIAGIKVIVTDELTEAQYQLVKLLFARTDDSQHK
jgi:hypothetical protein